MTTPTPTTAGRLPVQRQPAMHELAGVLRGDLALPGTDSYHRLTAAFNQAVELCPLAVVQAADAYDVAAAVRVATRHGLRVGVQCTGHGASAAMQGAVLVHTGGLDECVVHPEGWARVGAGVRWRTVIDAAAPLGLTPLAGSSSGVGVVGYTTGGGLGPLARTYGLASDRVRALDVVTGEGRLVRATPSEHCDLFWALRGGRGAAGIVTAVEFDLVPLQTVYGGAVFFGTDDLVPLLHQWRTWSASLPETATTSVAVMQLPSLPQVPPPLAGRMTLAVRFAFTGPAQEGAALLAPLRALATPVLDGVGELPVTALDAIHSDPKEGMPVEESATLLRDLPPDALAELLRVVGPGSGSVLAKVELRPLGGAVSRAGQHASAICGRDAGYQLVTIGLLLPPVADAVKARSEQLLDALAPWSTGGTLPTFAGGARSYDAATLERLRDVVRAHDPGRVLLAADPLFTRT
jgi:hypothetical protein